MCSTRLKSYYSPIGSGNLTPGGYRVPTAGQKAHLQLKSTQEFVMKVQTGIKAGQHGLEGVRITNKKPTGKGGI